MTVQRCPVCNTRRQADGRAGCPCGARGTIAPADVDPLRIRPYVHMQGPGPATASGRGPARPEAARTVSVTPPPPRADRPGAGGEARRVPPPPGRHGGEPPEAPGNGRRGRRAAAVTGAALAALAVPLGLFVTLRPDPASVDSALPDDVSRVPSATVPSAPAEPGTASPARSATGATGAAPATTVTASAPATGGAVVPVPTAATRSPSGSPKPGTSAPKPSGSAPSARPVLSMGASGPEVKELQERLIKAGGLYSEPADGQYDAGVRDAVATFQAWRAVTGDPDGVYGEHTRQALETETQTP